MRLTRLITLLVLALAASGIVIAQTPTPGFSPPMVKIPWNNYTAYRIPNNFQTIIGESGTYLIPNTSNRYGGGQLYNFSLTANQGGNVGFPFFFLGNAYSTVQVDIAGYIGFNQANYAGYGWGNGSNYPTLAYSNSLTYGWNPAWYSYDDKVLWAYWSDLRSSGVSNPSGGVYYRVDGTAPNRVMTFEWRAMGAYYPSANPGNFQAKLYESPAGKIELFYGPNSIDRYEPSPGKFGYGALVGIKNYGQAEIYGAGTVPVNDENKFLIMCDPAAVPDTVAVTTARTFVYASIGWTYHAEIYSYYMSYATNPGVYYRSSPYWHYKFPTKDGQQIGYRIIPVLDDVAGDSIWFTPTKKADVYLGGSAITINTQFLNVGKNIRQNVPMEAKVYRDQDLVNPVATFTNLTGFPTATAQGGKSQFTVGTLTQPITDITGIYTVRVYAKLDVDQDISNDTITGQFYISKANDVATWKTLQPISNSFPLFYQYPVGIGVPIEARFLNIGFNKQKDVLVGYAIYDENGTEVAADRSSIIPGDWDPAAFRDINLPPWTPTTPGRYYLKIFTLLANDENRLNDTLPNWRSKGTAFDVNYEIELAALPASVGPHSPQEFQSYPDGKPIPVQANFNNNGISDATNVPATIQIRDKDGNIVYSRTATILSLVGGGTPWRQEFPDFVPNGPGQYCLTATVSDPQDPITGNNTTTWCFNIKARYSGLIRVGFGERFRTIQEAWDSVNTYGVSGPLTLELVDDQYTVGPANGDPSQPALDMRGHVVGLGANASITWRPNPSKTDVQIDLKSPSGIGVWYGQADTNNPSGYITWDGGANKALRFVLENTTPTTTSGYHNISVPFFLGQGASNYTVRNCRIEPFDAANMRKTAVTLTVPSYTQSFNQFNYPDDLAQVISSGVLLRNSTPIDPNTGTNALGRDTLRNQNNVIEGNVIRDFGYGIASVGAGPLYVVGAGAYIEYNNQNNTYSDNQISNVGRAGVALVYEKGSKVEDNQITGVTNTSKSTAHAIGIWLSAGGNTTNNRGYSSDITIERNMVSNVSATTGNGGGIWAETNENVFVSPSNKSFRFPVNSATNLKIWNNMVWNYAGQVYTGGIGQSIEPTTRIDFVTTGNKVENNTIYNANTAATQAEYGIASERSMGTIQNNIIAVVSQNKGWQYALGIRTTDLTNFGSDYNIYWMPNGGIADVQKLSKEGYALPSPPSAQTLNQWRYLSGLDQHSVSGNVTNEFKSTTPGSVDLHINAQYVGSLSNNRGVKIAGMTTDIDGQPRGSAALNGRYDIGADEFTGAVRNNDVMAEDIFGPVGYQGTSGQFSDAEYVMSGPTVNLTGRIRNVGGMPVASNQVTMTVQHWTGTTWVSDKTVTKTSSVDVSEQRNVSFGTFAPSTLKELGLNDAYYGTSPNVTPIYRLRLRSGTDDNVGNNAYEKTVRFYVQRAVQREVLVSVESYQSGNASNSGITNVVALGNKLNADTVIAALDSIRWSRADGVGTEDYDLFERDKWPKQNLDFRAWRTVIWSQGEESQGLEPEERVALKGMLESRSSYDRSNLIIAGQEVAKKHDVALSPTNGQVADQDFVRNYLRSTYSKATQPANYSGLKIQGVAITPGKYEMLAATGVVNDAPPTPAVLKVTVTNDGIAKTSHQYVDLPPLEDPAIRQDTTAGVVSNGVKKNVLYYAFDWRHAGRFWAEGAKSGAQRLLLAGLDYFNQYNTTVPVKLVSFDAYESGRRSVNVEWTTASEEQVSVMRIERAEVTRTAAGESVGSYELVAQRSPEGSETRGSSYRVVDEGVESGKEYSYMLVTVEADGQREVAGEKRVKLSGSSTAGYSLSVAPNPVRENGELVVRVAEETEGVVTVYNERGQQVEVLHSGMLSAGETRVSVDARELPSGVYTVRLQTKSGVELSEKLTVQK